MKEQLEFFKQAYEFKGKHARMAAEMCETNCIEKSYFRRVIDIYIMAVIIGFRMNRKARTDYGDSMTKTIFAETMIKEKKKLDFLMQMVLLLDDEYEEDETKRLNYAFRGAEDIEQHTRFERLFDSYVLGGVEELYEWLVIRHVDVTEVIADKKAGNIMRLIEQFS